MSVFIAGLITLALFFSQPALAVRGPTGPYTVGDEIPLTLTLRYAKELSVALPNITTLGPFTVKKLEKTSTLEGDEIVQSLFFTLTTFSVGETTIPSVRVDFRRPDGTVGSVVSQEIPVRIRSVLDDAIQDIREAKPPMRIMERNYTLLWIAGVAAALGLAAVMLIRSLRRHEALRQQIPVAPRSPAEIALQHLESLAGAGLLEKGLWKEYYSRISDVLRRYIEARKSFAAMEMTTAEIFRALKSPSTESSPLGLLRAVLEESDLVKFAKFVPNRDGAREALQGAKRFVISWR